MAGSLMLLPRELWLDILEHVQEPEDSSFQEYLQARRTFAAVSRTCRALNTIGLDFLYRHYRVDTYHAERPVTLPFLRTVATHPSLAKRVKKIEVSKPEIVETFRQGQIHDGEGFRDIIALKCRPDDELHQNEWVPEKSRGIRSLEIATLVQFCQEIECLKVPYRLARLKRRKPYQGPKLYLPEYLHPLLDPSVRTPLYANLRVLEMNMIYFNHGVRPIALLMLLPSLKELVVHYLHDGEFETDLTESWSAASRSSSITTLRLHNSRLKEASLATLFGTIRALQTCEIRSTQWIPPTKCATVLDALQVHSRTLTTLIFNVSGGRREYEFGRLDFNQFPRLRHLHVDFVPLFGKPRGSFSAENIAWDGYPIGIQLLPRALETLTLRVDAIYIPSANIAHLIADLCSRQPKLQRIDFTFENRHLSMFRFPQDFEKLAADLRTRGTILNF